MMGVQMEKFRITLTIDLILTAQIICFIFIYISVTGLLLAVGHFFKEEIVILICHLPNFVVDFYSSFKQYLIFQYSSFKQYLILQEVDRSMQELKVINSEISNSKLAIKRLKNEIQIFQESSKNLKDMMLPDTTEIDAKLRERRAEYVAEHNRRVYLYWYLFGGSVVYEAIILWIFWE